MHPPRAVLAILAAPVAIAGVLAGCGGDSDTPERDPADRLAAAKQGLDDAASIEIELSTEDLPSGVDGVVSASGVGNHDPAFEGTIEISAAGFAGEAPVIAVDDQVWAELPFTSAYVEVDTASYGAPDPAALMSSDGGISSVLTEATDVSEAGEQRDGDTVLTEFTGTVPGETMAALFPSADAGGSFEAAFTLDDNDELDTATLTGPFYEGADEVTYDIGLEPSDEAVEITRP